MHKTLKNECQSMKKGERIDYLYEDDLFLDQKSLNTWKYYDLLVNYYVGSCLCERKTNKKREKEISV